jgi:hypothetical protein
MDEFKLIIDELSSELKLLERKGKDFSDIGNTVGFVIGKYFDTQEGFELESFLSGLRHGISLVDGTHD